MDRNQIERIDEASKMRKWYTINAKADVTDILIYDIIGQDFWGEGVTAKSLVNELDGLKTNLKVYLNTPGGDIHEGKAIINAFNRYKEKNKTRLKEA